MTYAEAKQILQNATLPMTAEQSQQFKRALQIASFGSAARIVIRTYDHDANSATPEITIPATYDNDSNPSTPEIPVPPTPSFWNRLKFW